MGILTCIDFFTMRWTAYTDRDLLVLRRNASERGGHKEVASLNWEIKRRSRKGRYE